MSDDFERAVLFAFDQTGNVSEALRSQAHSMLQRAAASTDAWALCMAHMESTNYAEVKFWCLQTLHSIVIGPSFASIPQSSRDELKRVLLMAGTNSNAARLAPFIRNKIAQVLVAIASCEFPEIWPSFFHDLLQTLQQGKEAVDLFCRVLISINEDLVSLEVPRSAEEAKQSMHFKDAMRDNALQDISVAWSQLIAAYKDLDSGTTEMILESIRPYVHWIDISLVANETFIGLLFSILRDCKEEEPRAAAAAILTEIVSKRMEPSAKLSLIQRLGIVPTCAQWSTGFPLTSEEPNLAVSYSKLLASLATEVLEAWKRVENSMLSMSAVGLDIGADAGAEASSTCTAASEMLDALFPAVLEALKTGNDEIASSVAPFLLSYIARIRLLTKRNGMLPEDAAAQLPAILEAVADCARFPEDSLAYEAVALSTVEKVASEEEEAAVADRRQELFSLFKNTAKLAPNTAYTAVGKRLEMALSQSCSKWQDVELPLSLLFLLGEGASEGVLKAGNGPLAVLAAGVVQTEIPHVQHRLVALALLETCARYTKVWQQHSEILPRIVGLFLGPTGLGHPSESVPPRAAYLFCRLCKVLRQQMGPLTRDILQSLQPHLASIAASPISEAAQVNKAAGATGIRNALGTGISAGDDRLYAFEAAGLLIGSEEVSEQQQLEWLWGLLSSLISQLENSLESPTLVLQALDALTRLSKGFVPKICSEKRQQVGAMLVRPLTQATEALRYMPEHKILRIKYLAYIHRLVESLGISFLGKLYTVLCALQHPRLDAPDMSDIIILLNQIITKFPTAPDTIALVKAIYPDVVKQVHFILSEEWDWSGVKALPAMATSPAARLGYFPAGPAPAGSTEDLRERGELQRSYYAFLHAVATSGDLAELMLGLPRDALSTSLNDLIQGAKSHVDAGVRKTCIQALGRLAMDWLEGRRYDSQTKDEKLGGKIVSSAPLTIGQNEENRGVMDNSSIVSDKSGSTDIEEPIPGLVDFFLHQFGCEALILGLASSDSNVDIRDAAAISLLTEVAIQLKTIYRLLGQSFLVQLCTSTLPQLGWPAIAGEQLAKHISQSEPKELKAYLKAAVLELRGNHNLN